MYWSGCSWWVGRDESGISDESELEFLVFLNKLPFAQNLVAKFQPPTSHTQTVFIYASIKVP